MLQGNQIKLLLHPKGELFSLLWVPWRHTLEISRLPFRGVSELWAVLHSVTLSTHFGPINPNQIKSLLLSHHLNTSALVSEILTNVLQTVQKKKHVLCYIWTVHIYRLYRRQCAKYTYIYSVHTVYYKDIFSYQYTLYTVCTYLHYVHIYT